MSWQKRGNNRYYYEERKVGGRVVKTYIGKAGSEFADAIAGIDRCDRKIRALARDGRRQDIDAMLQGIDQAAEQVRAYYSAVKQITDGAIRAAGYHRHNGSEWRKRRGTDMARKSQTHKPGLEHLTSDLTPKEKQAEAQAMNYARVGSGRDVPAMNAALDRLTAANGGSLPDCLTMGGQMIERWAERFTLGNDPDLLTRECVRRELAAVAAGVAGPNPSPLEKLLADRIAVCYAHVQFAEHIYQTAMMAGCTHGEKHIFTEQIDGAQKRYLASIKALAEVQRLRLPMSVLSMMQIALPGATQIGQVNVGEKQMNVAGQAQTAASG